MHQLNSHCLSHPCSSRYEFGWVKMSYTAVSCIQLKSEATFTSNWCSLLQQFPQDTLISSNAISRNRVNVSPTISKAGQCRRARWKLVIWDTFVKKMSGDVSSRFYYYSCVLSASFASNKFLIILFLGILIITETWLHDLKLFSIFFYINIL